MSTIDVETVENHVQNLRNTISDSFDQRVAVAKEKLSSLESALSDNRNHHQAGVTAELADALTRLQETCSNENKQSVIDKVEHIKRLSDDSNNRTEWYLPKKDWPIDLDEVLVSVTICTELVELQENAEALMNLSKKVASDIQRLTPNPSMGCSASGETDDGYG